MSLLVSTSDTKGTYRVKSIARAMCILLLVESGVLGVQF